MNATTLALEHQKVQEAIVASTRPVQTLYWKNVHVHSCSGTEQLRRKVLQLPTIGPLDVPWSAFSAHLAIFPSPAIVTMSVADFWLWASSIY